MILSKVLLALLVNAIPIYGVTRLSWSASSVLVMFWIENLVIAIFTCLRILLHRAWTHTAGHWRVQAGSSMTVNGKPVQTKGLLAGYAMFAFIFTFAHGIFVFGICAILASNYPDQPQWQLSWPQLALGAKCITAALALDLLVDIPRLRHGSFAWLKAAVNRRMGRVIVLHLAIIFGMFGMLITKSPFSVIYVLFALKALVDVAGAAAGAAQEPALVSEAPRFVRMFGKERADRYVASMNAQMSAARKSTGRDDSEEDEVVRP